MIALLKSAMPAFSQVGFSAVARGAYFLVVVLLYKRISPQEAGVYAIALAIATVLAAITEFGLRGYLVREVARNMDRLDWCAGVYSQTVTSRLLALLPCFGGGMLLGAAMLPGEYVYAMSLILLAAWLDSSSNVLRGALRGFHYIVADGVLAAIFKALLLCIVAWLFRESGLLFSRFLVAVVGVSLVEFMVSLWVIRVKTGLSPLPSGSMHMVSALMKKAFPFTILAILGLVYFRTGLFFIGLPGTPEAFHQSAGYSLAARLPEGLAFIPLALMNAVIPFLSRNAAHREKLLPQFRQMELLVGTCAVFLAVGMWAFTDELILALGTKEYLSFALIFRLYGISVLFSYLQYVYSNMLIALNHERKVAACYGLILVINLILNASLVWKLGALGAVISLIVCEAFAVGFNLFHLWRLHIQPDGRIILGWAGVAVFAGLSAAASQGLSGLWKLAGYGIFCLIAGVGIYFFSHRAVLRRNQLNVS